MSISREGLNLLKELEGFRPRAVPLANGRWLIGYGHTKYARPDMRITEDEAELLLRHDLIGVADELNTKIFAPLSQGQFDALILFAYNIGLPSFRASGVCDLLNVGQPLAAAKEIGRWRVAMVNGAPVVIDALARRRAAELELFLRTPNEVRPATTHLLQPLSEPEVEGTTSPLQVFSPAPVPTPSVGATSAPVEPAPVQAPASLSFRARDKRRGLSVWTKRRRHAARSAPSPPPGVMSWRRSQCSTLSLDAHAAARLWVALCARQDCSGLSRCRRASPRCARAPALHRRRVWTCRCVYETRRPIRPYAEFTAWRFRQPSRTFSARKNESPTVRTRRM